MNTGWSNVSITLNNQSAVVPVWWFFMHAISKAVIDGAVSANRHPSIGTK